MYDPTVVVADFETAGEAHVAVARLEAEGIAATVAGDTPNAASFSMFGRMPFASRVQVSVAQADAGRARAILDRLDQAELDSGWEADAEAAIEGWICLSCDTEAPADQDVCPECGASRSAETAEDEE